MTSRSLKRTISCFLTMCLTCCGLAASAQQSLQFSLARTEKTDPVHGQIDWPGGTAEQWDGRVVMFISAAGPSDRDGWLVQALETVWAKRTPLKDLSAALVKQGVAVVRFDNPGALPPAKKCRETILKTGLSEKVLWERCIDLKILGQFTPERHLDHLEQVVFHVQNLMPAARKQLVLFGFSEGLMHAAALAERGNVKLSGLVSIGSPAERFDTATRWQGTRRMIESLELFDSNADGIVTNEEIRRGHKRGVNHFLNLSGWLSNNGQWDSHTRYLLADDMTRNYEQLLRDFSDISGPGKLGWRTQANGVRTPDITEASWQQHFYGQTAPAEVMRALKIPGLFIWGDKDWQVSAARQVKAVEEANSKGAVILYRRFPQRHHLLSKRVDYDWLEKDYMPVIAEEVSAFLSRHVRPLQSAAQLEVFSDQPSCNNLSMTATLP